MSETISFQLQAIENGTEKSTENNTKQDDTTASQNNDTKSATQSNGATSISNAEIQLENINLGQKSKTNDEGIASFEIESTQKLKPFRAKLIHDDYQEYPIHDRVLIPNALKSRNEPYYVLRFNRKLDKFAVQQVLLEPRYYELKDSKNEMVVKSFYKQKDTIKLTASIDTSKAKEDEIKWAYKILTLSDMILLQQRDAKEHNPLNTKTLNPAINKMLKDSKQILIDSQSQKPYFSNTTAYTIRDVRNNIKEPDNIYKGKDLEITLPHTGTNDQQAIAIFAYQYEPNYKACQVIRINDYPQITIDCTLAETLRVHHRQDNISTLGWGVSYVCQKLWHDNPSNAKDLTDLIYTDSHSQDFLDSIPNLTMKSIVKDILPRITLQEFAKDSNNKCSAIKSRIQEISDNNLRFYAELDWDKFYMKFPLMRELNNQLLQTLSFNDINDWVRSNFLNSKFYDFFMEWINIKSNLDIVTQTANTNNQAQLIVDFSKIYEGKTKNKDIFLLKNIEYQSQNFCNEQSLSNVKSPYKLWGNCFYAYGIGDIDFAMQTAKDMTRAIALYALTGKFNIYYIPSLFKITQGKDNAIDIQITEIKAYIFDGFDFIGTPEQFVGAWDYEKMEFITGGSILQGYFKDNVVDMANKLPLVNTDKNISKDLDKAIMRNLDYQNTQTYFNLGCDFRILTSTFKDIQVYPLAMPINIRIH